MISKKLKVLKVLTQHLQGMNPAWQDLPEGMESEVCPYDMGQSVFRGRLTFGDEVPVPFIALLEAPRQFDPLSAGTANLIEKDNWTILIQGFATEDIKHPLDPAYDLLAWTQMRLSRITVEKPNGARGGLYPMEWHLGGLVADIRYQIPIVRPGKDDVSDTAYFYLPVSVGVVTDLTMPFVEED